MKFIKLPDLEPISCLLPVIAPYKRQTALFLLFGILASLVEGLGIGLMIPLLKDSGGDSSRQGPLLNWLYDVLDFLPQDHRLEGIAGLIILAILAKALLAFLFTNLSRWLRSRVSHDLRVSIFRQLLTVSKEYLDQRQGGSLFNLVAIGADDAAFSLQCLLWLLLNLITVIVYSLLLMAIDWKLTLAIVISLLLVFIVVRLVTGGVRKFAKSTLNLHHELSHKFKEAMIGGSTIRAFGRESSEYESFVASSLACHQSEARQNRLIALTHPLSESLAAVALMIMVLIALKVGLSLPVMVTCVFMMLRLQPQIQSANLQYSEILSRHASVTAVQEFLNPHDKPSVPVGYLLLEHLKQGIYFEDVCFTYGKRHTNALTHINLDIAKGSSIALVGSSGAGKSTLLHLLCRFYQPTSGRILVDGMNLNSIDIGSWRQRVAVVSQDVHIFSTTVRDNIAYGKAGASHEEILDAATRAHAHEFISELPNGYDTLVGDRGLLLSGGQRQRLSIARAILSDPDILILDEATNALDSISEAFIQSSIEELGKTRTVIVVAHRLSTIEKADRIVVMDRGEIVEQGRFSELLQKDGNFAALYRSHRLGILDPLYEDNSEAALS